MTQPLAKPEQYMAITPLYQTLHCLQPGASTLHTAAIFRQAAIRLILIPLSVSMPLPRGEIQIMAFMYLVVEQPMLLPIWIMVTPTSILTTPSLSMQFVTAVRT